MYIINNFGTGFRKQLRRFQDWKNSSGRKIGFLLDFDV